MVGVVVVVVACGVVLLVVVGVIVCGGVVVGGVECDLVVIGASGCVRACLATRERASGTGSKVPLR